MDKNNEGFRKIILDLWDMIKSKVPIPIIIIIAIYIALVLGGMHIYDHVVKDLQTQEEILKNATNVFFGGLIVVTVLFIISLIVAVLLNRKTKKKHGGKDVTKENGKTVAASENSLNGQLSAFIVDQNAPERDEKFNHVNSSVKKTYSVLGVTLSSIAQNEALLKKMAENGVNIKVCMANPNIAVENLCKESIETHSCAFKAVLDSGKCGYITKENYMEALNSIKNEKDYLCIYHMLINSMHFREYYDSVTDYKKIITTSYDSLNNIKNHITDGYGNKRFELKFSDSFIPISMTLVDEDEDDGIMVVEFHLPFSDHKVLFEIKKDDNEELFRVFVNFYNKVWERGVDP